MCAYVGVSFIYVYANQFALFAFAVTALKLRIMNLLATFFALLLQGVTQALVL